MTTLRKAGPVAVLFPVVLLCAQLALAADKPPDPAPGKHTHLPCIGGSTYTYDLFIPKAYATDKERLFPVLYTSSAFGNPGTLGMDAWAEKNDVIIVSINDTKNGMKDSLFDGIQDDVIKSVEATLRLHPCLRFSMGMSGAGQGSMSLARRYADKHAGVLMMAHSGNGEICPKHIAVAFVHGDKDTIHPPSAVLRAYQGFKSRGNPVRILTVPGRGHEPATTPEAEAMLNWMLGYERLTHPKLSPQERADAQAEVKRRIEAAPKIADPAARLAECLLLLDLPDAEKRPDYKALVSAWFGAQVDLARAKTDPVEKHELLTDLSLDTRVQTFRLMELNKVTPELAELRKLPAVKPEWAAFQLYQQVVQMEAQAGKAKAKLALAAQGYEAVTKQYPDTRIAKRAAAAQERLNAELKK